MEKGLAGVMVPCACLYWSVRFKYSVFNNFSEPAAVVSPWENPAWATLKTQD